MDAHTSLTYGVDTALAQIDTVIADARPAREADKLSLDTHGFTLEPQRTGLKTDEFFDKAETGIVERVYYAEMKTAIKKATGCDEVLILEHIVRDAGAADTRGKKNPFAGGGNGINGYAGVVHTDFRADRARELARSKGSGKKEMFSSQRDRARFMIVNTWRNISDDRPIYNNTLALCDGKTVRDVLPCDVQHPNGKRSEQYRLSAARADEHRWFYFPRMQKDELLIFKQYDSDPKARARFCFHTAFNDPTVPADAPARQSVEVRAVALFNEAMTAPPPVVRNLSDEVFEARVMVPQNRAPAARREVQGAHSRRTVPVKAVRLNTVTKTKPQGRSVARSLVDVPIDLDLQRAIRASLGASAAEARADALEEAMLAEEEERERLALEEAIERSLIDLS